MLKSIDKNWWKKNDTTDKNEDSWSGYSGYGFFGKRYKYRSSLGWSSGKLLDTTSSYYSSPFYGKIYGGGVDLEKSEKVGVLLSQAYKTVRDMIVILDFPFKIDIQFSKTATLSNQDSRRVFIPTKIFDRDDYTDQEKINVFCGNGVHEAAHLKYTNRSVLANFQNKIRAKATIEVDGIKVPITSEVTEFIVSLINIIEDERVEDLLLSERPGYSDFIEKYKFWHYKQYISTTKTCTSEAEVYLNNLFRLIRFPENLEDSILEKYSESFERIKNILTPLPSATKDSCMVGFKIYLELIKIFQELKFPEIKDVASKLNKSAALMFDTVLYGVDGDVIEFGCEGDNPTELISKTIQGNDLLRKLTLGFAEKGVEKYTYFERIDGNKRTYQGCVNRIRKYIPGIKKVIKGVDKNYSFNIYGCRNGLLDTTKLAEAYQDVPQVYVRQGKVTTSKTTLCVLVDESGSMGYKKADMARDAAVLLNEAFGNLPGVDLYIYGHTADLISSGSTSLNIYREGKKYNPKYSLSEIQARYENRDGVAISEVAARVRKYTKSNAIMLVISDGAPCAHNYHGECARKDVKDRVEKLKKDGFEVIQITIDHVGGADDMFETVIDLQHSLDELPKKLSQVIKKIVVSDKKTTIS